MFGTLIVLLPSEYTGGAVVIRHEGREVMLERLAFVYNLIRSKREKNLLPPNTQRTGSAGDLASASERRDG